MSLPNIPDINPDINICKEDVIKLLYTSIAMQEIGLSHILNAEGEILQYAIEKDKNSCCFSEILKINESISQVMDKIYNMEKLLSEKLKLIRDI